MVSYHKSSPSLRGSMTASFSLGCLSIGEMRSGLGYRHDREYRHRDGGSMLRPPFQADIAAQVSNFFARAAVTSGDREPCEPVAINFIEFIGDGGPVGRSGDSYDGGDAP